MAITETTVFGDLRVQIGTYTAVSTTATITTGFTKLFACVLISNANATSPVVVLSAGTATCTTASSDTGVYIAIGK